MISIEKPGTDARRQILPIAMTACAIVLFISITIAPLLWDVFYVPYTTSYERFKDDIISTAHLQAPGHLTASAGPYSRESIAPSPANWDNANSCNYRAYDENALTMRGNYRSTVMDSHWAWYDEAGKKWGHAHWTANDTADNGETPFNRGELHRAMNARIDSYLNDFAFSDRLPAGNSPIKYILQIAWASSSRIEAMQFDLIGDLLDRSLESSPRLINHYFNGSLADAISIMEDAPFSLRLSFDDAASQLSGSEAEAMKMKYDDNYIVYQIRHLDRERNKYTKALLDFARQANAGFPTWLSYSKAKMVWEKTSARTGHWIRLEWKPYLRTGWLLAHSVDSESYDLLDENEMIKDEKVVGGLKMFWTDRYVVERDSYFIRDDEGNVIEGPDNFIRFPGYSNVPRFCYGFTWRNESGMWNYTLPESPKNPSEWGGYMRHDKAMGAELLKKYSGQRDSFSAMLHLTEEIMQNVTESVKLLETERKQAWIERFPWKPVVDSSFPYVPEKYVPSYQGDPIEEKIVNAQKENYAALKNLFSNELRYTAQFEMMHDILAKYGRTEDPVLAVEIFTLLWHHFFYKYRDEERASSFARGIVASLTDPRSGDEYFFSEAGRIEAEEIMQALLSGVQGMENLPRPYYFAEGNARRRMTFDQAVRSGDPALVGDFLVPYRGWAARYEALLRRQKEQSENMWDVGIPDLPPGYPPGPAVILVPRVGEDGEPEHGENGNPEMDAIDLGVVGKASDLVPAASQLRSGSSISSPAGSQGSERVSP